MALRNQLLLLLLLVAGVINAYEHYEGYQVLRVVPQNAFELESVAQLEEDGVDFWRIPDRIQHFADLMVSPLNRDSVIAYLQQRNISYSFLIEDVDKMVRIERLQQSVSSELLRLLPRDNDEVIPGFFQKYRRLAEIEEFIDALVKRYPDTVAKLQLGQSHEGRPIRLLRIGADSNSAKPVVFIEGGIHAREWVSPSTVMYFSEQLASGFERNDPVITDLLNKFDFYIIPVLNVDGYEYTHTNSRLWRKTRKPSSSSCYGTDANRNFGYKWGGTGASTNPCSETYRGASAFSEPETQAESEYILNNLNGRVKIYLSIHSYGQYWLYPWGWTSQLTPHDKELNAKAKIATEALGKRYGTKYIVGTSTNVLYAAAGGADDWAYGGANVLYSYTVELRDTGSYGFQLPASQIIPTGEETTDAFIALSKAVAETL